ncbi:MAG: MFS transporter [Ardenticatenales bacterium]
MPTPTDERHNLAFASLNSAFFGVGLGMVSFVSVMPLFAKNLGASPIALALVPWLQPLGWYLPQLLLVKRVGRLERFHPAVLLATIVERAPFLGLVVLALALPWLTRFAAVVAMLLLLLVFGLGGGLTAPPWQSLLVRMTAPGHRGVFIGVMVGAMQLTNAIGAWSAGHILEGTPDRFGFAICFAIGAVAMAVSYGFLTRLREPLDAVTEIVDDDRAAALVPSARAVWRSNARFRRFVAARQTGWFALMPAAFFALDAQQRLGATAADIGWYGAWFALVQVVLSPVLGWLSDHVGHRRVMAAGAIAAGLAAALAAVAPTKAWMGVVFALAGTANIALTMIPLIFILTFGDARTRPAYIGLGHSLAAPGLILAPVIGGALLRWTGGFTAAYALAAAAAVVTAVLLIVDRSLSPGRRPMRGVAPAVGV